MTENRDEAELISKEAFDAIMESEREMLASVGIEAQTQREKH